MAVKVGEKPLLDHDEPAPAVVENVRGRSPWLLTCEHGGRRMPRALGDLGLPPDAFDRHIAWDIGALGVAHALADLLDAPLVHQRYSRLVVDCNRPPSRPSFIPEVSDRTAIPGNRSLEAEARLVRQTEIWQPFQDEVSAAMASRHGLLAIHSFTPVFREERRPWHIGILYDRAERLAHHLHDHFRAMPGINAALNEPYLIDADDYTIPVHGDGLGKPAVLIEIRQDLIEAERGQQEWAGLLADAMIDRPPAVFIERGAA